MRAVSLAQDNSFALAIAPIDNRNDSAAGINAREIMALAMAVTI
jgi:hypothetical protein